jgi:hypothetical protein
MAGKTPRCTVCCAHASRSARLRGGGLCIDFDPLPLLQFLGLSSPLLAQVRGFLATACGQGVPACRGHEAGARPTGAGYGDWAAHCTSEYRHPASDIRYKRHAPCAIWLFGFRAHVWCLVFGGPVRCCGLPAPPLGFSHHSETET